MYKNIKYEKYTAIKIIKHTGNNRCYVTVPNWLIGKELKIELIETNTNTIKKVNKNSQINFPYLLAGQRIKINYEND